MVQFHKILKIYKDNRTVHTTYNSNARYGQFLKLNILIPRPKMNRLTRFFFQNSCSNLHCTARTIITTKQCLLVKTWVGETKCVTNKQAELEIRPIKSSVDLKFANQVRRRFSLTLSKHKLKFVMKEGCTTKIIKYMAEILNFVVNFHIPNMNEGKISVWSPNQNSYKNWSHKITDKRQKTFPAASWIDRAT